MSDKIKNIDEQEEELFEHYKYIAWILWIIGDIFCIPLFVYKEYYLSVAQFSIFIIIAFMGYYEWKKKSLEKQKT